MQSPGTTGNCSRYILQVYVGALSLHYEALSVEASKLTTAEEIVSCIVERLNLSGNNYELAEVAGESKERRLAPDEKPVSVMLLWPLHSEKDFHRFYLRESQGDAPWLDSYGLDLQIFRDFIPFLIQPENREYPDLCQLLDLNESTLLENLRQRFVAGHIYTYVGSILIALNPFKFYPIYNPKYVRLYQNQRVGPILPPHIFAIADNAYYCMLKEKRNQCVVISGESGSGKTESTNFLLHHLTALSQKGSHGSGVEQTILSAGPVLEAFGNAKTAHNNNSSRFGKFIQVKYKENGMVQGAVVQKYLLEKSRIVSQGPLERNYHVFYYLLSGATQQERELLHLLPADKYFYLNSKNLSLENCDEKYEFSRLKQSMEMVGFSPDKQRRLFNVLSAVLLLGNVEFFPKKSTYHHDESVQVRNLDNVSIISELLKVKQDTLLAALTSKRVKASGETLIMQYKLPEAIAARDALAKCLYGSLFDWIVLQVNHALLNKDQVPHTGHSIGVLDIFGFEDFDSQNSFEQLCINYANEHLQYYFNLHVFKYEQNEYKREGIKWRDIEFMDNSECLQLFESKPTGLLCILDDLCNFPGATNETLLQKFNSVHRDNKFYEKPQKKENAFIIRHYAGKVKYQVAEMREKNMDLMRQDIVSVLKNSSMAFVRELVGADPVAVFRWAILRAFFRGYFAFRQAGIKHRKDRNDQSLNKVTRISRFRHPNESILSSRNVSTIRHDSSSITPATATSNALISPHGTSSVKKTWSHIAKYNRNLTDAGKVKPFNQSSNSIYKYSNDENGIYMYNSKQGYAKRDAIGIGRHNNNNNNFNDEDTMARASQILQKNKSFRPRDRPKKGLKNLQSVKTLTAGQNLTNATTVKTRKQPLTVTAQFQNSLTALMDTLNQANPFFIRCIKSNGQKISNKFDDATVIRQLRYTGMLETVRIRRAGYNVRLTYEEFIQLYRILLPKGLVSSQKDVCEFMDQMDLNKQHYQLGITKIYMRESQKMCLDYRLHTKIIDSIIMIQRWFKTTIQRNKFTLYRSAATKIQSLWRMCLAQKHVEKLKLRIRAAIIIQSAVRMFITRKWYRKLISGIVTIQAHIRGKQARVRFKKSYRQRAMKERYKLRPTQSLPVNDRASSAVLDSQHDVDMARSYPKLTHFSLDLETESNASRRKALLDKDPDLPNVLNKAEHQFRTLLISTASNNGDDSINHGVRGMGNTATTVSPPPAVSKSNFSPDKVVSEESVDSWSPRAYNIENASKKYFEENRWESPKTSPARYVEMSQSSPQRRSISGIGSTFTTTTEASSKVNVIHNASNVSYPVNYMDTLRNNSSPSRTLGSAATSINVKQKRRELAATSSQQSINLNDVSSTGSTSTTSSKAYAADVQQTSQNNTQTTKSNPIKHLVQTKPMSSADHSDELTPKGKAAALLGTDPVKYRADRSDHHHHHHHGHKQQRTDSETASPSSQQLYKQITPPAHANSRRNSDPSSNKITLLDVNRGNDMYQSSTDIDIAGHRFHKVNRIVKGEKCACCQENDAFVNEGHRCLDCKLLVHTKCIQNGGVKTLHCEAKRSKRQLRKNFDKAAPPRNSKYSGTREYTDSADKIISDAKELQLMQDFITQKICKMDNDCEKPSAVDRVFKQALREFKDNLVAQYSIAHKQKSDMLNIKYRDLIANFEQVMETSCANKKDDFPLTMGVNAFRGFMNEFMNSRDTEKPKAKRKKEKKRKVDEHTNYNGHSFQLTIINIPTVCEICQLFLLWPIERGLVCQNCRLTCHKKCYQKSANCNKVTNQTNNNTQFMPIQSSTLFGVPLTNLCIAEGGVKIPIKIEQLITKIEMHGLYTEGIYRKSGVNSKIKELKTKMSETPSSAELDYETYNIHVLANVLKSFLREMPEPLLTFDRYDDFLRASELSEMSDRVSTLMSLIKKLPPSHHALLERLVFHLALVAQREQYNRMSASSLAIVFSPCVLRTNRIVPAQDSLNDIGRQTKCIETLITQKMMNVRSTLADIDTLDTAAHTATTRLSTLRSSKVFTPEEVMPRPTNLEAETEEMLLEDHIQEIKKEKAMLTSTLPSLARASSDDDFLSTDMEGEGGSLDDLSGRTDDNVKESIDSSFGSLNDQLHYTDANNCSAISTARDSQELDEPPIVCYNLREQNIDYLPNPQQPYKFSATTKFANTSGGGSSGGASSTGSTISIGIGASGDSIIHSHNQGEQQSQQQPSSSSSKWASASQQNLNYAILDATGVDYHKQKSLAVRSMSGGYESTMMQPIPDNNFRNELIGKNMPADDGKAYAKKKPKRDKSLDDEPIMV